MWLGERQDVLEQRLIVIVPLDECDLKMLCEMLQDAGHDTLILGSTALDQHINFDRRHTTLDATAAVQESTLSLESAPPHQPVHLSNPQAAVLEVLREICESLSQLPFGWQVAVIKALLTHACTVARHYGPPPQHTTPSA
jgi:hypothetical protein